MCTSPQIRKDTGVTYACGNCEACHTRYINHWIFRLNSEMRHTLRALFITLTYDYDNIPFSTAGKFTLKKKDYQDFLKRLRKAMPDRQLKYVLCGEYGTKNKRPHYHVILFNVDWNDYHIINKAWGNGLIHMGTVTDQSIAYTFKYSIKGSLTPLHWSQVKSFVSMSKGLGERYAFDITYKKTDIIDKNGKKCVRYSKIRTPRAHFARKMNDIYNAPFIVVSRNNVQYKISIPRFYLKNVDYDKDALAQIYENRRLEKFRQFTEPQQEFYRQLVEQQAPHIQRNTLEKRKFDASKDKL